MKRSWSKSLLEFKGCSLAFAKKHSQVVLVSGAGYVHLKAAKMLSAGFLILTNAEDARKKDSLSSAQASPCYLKCKCLPRIHTHANLWTIRRRECKIWGFFLGVEEHSGEGMEEERLFIDRKQGWQTKGRDRWTHTAEGLCWKGELRCGPCRVPHKKLGAIFKFEARRSKQW